MRCTATLCLLLPCVAAQTTSRIPGEIKGKITGEIDSSVRTALPGTSHPVPASAVAAGQLDAATPLRGITLHFAMSEAQQASLQALLTAQQDPASAHYHHWLTPAQFAARFGASSADIAKTTTWLQRQGFTVQGANAAHTRITFSGTAGQAEQAFSTRLTRYTVGARSHFAPSQALSLPAALAAVTGSIGNLSSFRPQPHHRVHGRFTSSISGDHFLAPDDFTTIYDVKALYNAGYTGSGHSIVIIGQSAIATADVTAFRSAAGLAASTPTLTLVPGSGTGTETADSDEEESDLDVEWSGAIAQQATVNFVYVGNSPNYSVFDSLEYAIDNDLAPVISSSYGACESAYSSSEISTLQALLQQANAQGQTVIAAAGDSGAADCDYSTSTTTVSSATHGLAVDYPASSLYVTGIGGTEFTGDVTAASTYWSSSNNTSNGSALLYIPEEGWNDTSTTNGLDGTGGGKSTLFGKPSWQTGTGVPADSARDVPDVALNASPEHDGYLYCSQGSCTSGFRDASSDLTVAGGTSFGAPTFAAILTLIEQQTGSTGYGNINASLYSIAAASSAVFHDITTGTNIVPCTAGSTGCGTSGTIGYSAGAGYDQVTGLGTIDANALATAFAGLSTTGTGSSLIATTTALTAATITPVIDASDTFTVAVTPNSGSGTPTGTIQFAVDGANSGSAVTLASGTATFTASFAATGAHTITATYSGDSTYAASSGTLAVTAAATTTAAGSFTLSATDLVLSQGANGTSTITVTPAGGFTGTVSLAATTSVANACFGSASAVVSGTSSATAAITVSTSEKSCVSTGMRPGAAANHPARPGPGLPLLYAGLLPLFCLAGVGRRRQAWRALALTLCTLGSFLWWNGCGSSSSSSTAAAKGTYTITVTGTDSAASLTSSTTFTLTVD